MTYQKYEQARVPGGINLVQMCSKLGISRDNMFREDGWKEVRYAQRAASNARIERDDFKDVRMVPVISWARAGAGVITEPN